MMWLQQAKRHQGLLEAPAPWEDAWDRLSRRSQPSVTLDLGSGLRNWERSASAMYTTQFVVICHGSPEHYHLLASGTTLPALGSDGMMQD